MPERKYKDPVRQLMGYTYDHLLKFGFKNITRYQLGTDRELDYKGGMTSACYLGNKWINWLDLNPMIKQNHLRVPGDAHRHGRRAEGHNYAPPVRFMGRAGELVCQDGPRVRLRRPCGIASGQAFGGGSSALTGTTSRPTARSSHYTDENYFLPAAADAWGYVPAERGVGARHTVESSLDSGRRPAGGVPPPNDCRHSIGQEESCVAPPFVSSQLLRPYCRWQRRCAGVPGHGRPPLRGHLRSWQPKA